MKQKEIEEFLRQKPGYLKKGPGSLALHLGADINKCRKALSKIKKELRYPKEKGKDENLVLKSKWQAQTKEGIVWMESYRNVDTDPEPLTAEDWKDIFKESIFLASMVPLLIYALGGDILRRLPVWILIILLMYAIKYVRSNDASDSSNLIT